MNIGFVIALGGLFLWLLFGLVGFIQRRSQQSRDRLRDGEFKPVDSQRLAHALKEKGYTYNIYKGKSG